MSPPAIYASFKSQLWRDRDADRVAWLVTTIMDVILDISFIALIVLVGLLPRIIIGPTIGAALLGLTSVAAVIFLMPKLTLLWENFNMLVLRKRLIRSLNALEDVHEVVTWYNMGPCAIGLGPSGIWLSGAGTKYSTCLISADCMPSSTAHIFSHTAYLNLEYMQAGARTRHTIRFGKNVESARRWHDLLVSFGRYRRV